MYTDLHLHTIYSDGEFSPIEIIKLARREKVTTMAITDHNNLKGSKEAILNNPYEDLRIIPGVEFSAKSEPNINIHILGFNVDLNDKELNDLADDYEQDAKNQVRSLLNLLKEEYGIVFDEMKVEKMFSQPGNIGRPEVAKLCVEAGVAENVEDAFSRLLNPVKPRQAKKQVNPTAEALIKYIIDAGGIPCLAHPESLKMDTCELRRYIKELMSYGLQAVEVYHSKNPPELVSELEKIVSEYGLLVSAGSDYHGPIVTPKVHIRHGINENLNLEHVSILDAITEVKGYNKRVKLYVNSSKLKAVQVAEEVQEALIKTGYQIVNGNSDLVIGFGGDGTLLKWLNEQTGYPTEKYLGVNCGTLGFMQDFEIDNAYDFVQNIPNYVENKLYYVNLQVRGNIKNMEFHSINDFSILNAEDKTFRAAVNMDNEFLETYVGTGLIFASPTGSTARNISSVGSIMFPEIKAMQMTPIEPIVNSKIHCIPKSICIPYGKTVTLTPVNTDKIKIMSDGICVYEDIPLEISICLSDRYVTTLRDKRNSFVKKIREKLI